MHYMPHLFRSILVLNVIITTLPFPFPFLSPSPSRGSVGEASPGVYSCRSVVPKQAIHSATTLGVEGGCGVDTGSLRFTKTLEATITTMTMTARNESDDPMLPVRQTVKRKVVVESVPWTGCRGMLPLQRYRNPMPAHESYRWIRAPNTSVPIAAPSVAPSAAPSAALDQDDRAKQGKGSIDTVERRRRVRPEASLPLSPLRHLALIYVDSSMVVVSKPSGVLSVPGPARKPSIAGLVHDYVLPGRDTDEEDAWHVDRSVVHRLDMDTSGVMVFSRNANVTKKLHEAFRAKSFQGSATASTTAPHADRQEGVHGGGVWKTYEALLHGHLPVSEGEIDLPLVRDKQHPPFMKVYTGEAAIETVPLQQSDSPQMKGFVKMMSKAPKDSLTYFRVLAWEFLDQHDHLHDAGGVRGTEGRQVGRYPVTRVELVPITGRTHQLRVHMAAIGHPILYDNIYGFNGEGSPHGGISIDTLRSFFPHSAAANNMALGKAFERDGAGDGDNTEEETKEVEGEKRMKTNEWKKRLCLHARKLGLAHPLTGAPMVFEADAPF